jgi:hypothetical protein
MCSSETRRKLKTPIKTPLRLSSAKKTPKHSLTNDRYIPSRSASSSCHMEASYHMLVNGNQENAENNVDLIDTLKRQLINETCGGGGVASMANGGGSLKPKVLNLHSKPLDVEQAHAENLKNLYNSGLLSGNTNKPAYTRHIIQTADKILDAPDFRDDYCNNLY